MAINKEDIDAILAAQQAAWAQTLAGEIAVAAIEGAALIDFEIGGVVDFTLFETRALAYAETQAALEVTKIAETTREAVQAVIHDAIEGGWSIDETSKALNAVYEQFQTVRAQTIARTEIASAINWGKHESAKDVSERLGMQLEKTWSAVRDGRTRPTHAAVSGTKIKLNEQFSVGGNAAERPHDPNLPPSETIQCRCVLIYSEMETQ